MQSWTLPATLAVMLLVGSGCAKAAPAARPLGPRPLPPDSAELLRAALRSARPAFATQQEALRAGIYVPAPPAEPVASGTTRAAAQPPTGSGSYVIQVAAFSDPAAAQLAAAEAGRRFPERQVVIETAGTVYRVALAGWESAGAAAAALPTVQRLYPGAWVRRRGLS